MSTLHITNGDSAVIIMQQAGIADENDVILPWRDVLHEGPVPLGLSLQEMTEVRVNYIVEQSWGPRDETHAWFQYRDNLLSDFKRFDKVVLWFEHDLYDQLQLIQILAWFATQDLEGANIHLICTDNYLGTLTPKEMRAMQSHEKPLLYEQVVIGTTAWQTFSCPDPREWFNLLQQDTACLPFLQGAVLRLLQEYPDHKTGLTLTQTIALQQLGTKPMPVGQLFLHCLESEERRFMGDLTFWEYIEKMLNAEPALISLPEGIKLTLPATPDQILTITQQGVSLLSNENTAMFKTDNRWIGGVHLTSKNQWVWDDAEQSIEALSN